MKDLKEQYLIDLEEIRDELWREQNKNKLLDDKAALAIGAKREKDAKEEINDLNLELQMLQIQVEKLESEKQNLETEFEHVNRSLAESRDEVAALKLDLQIDGMKINKSLKLKLEDSVNKEKVSKLLCSELEAHLAKVRDELRLAEERNSWYEEKHNLCDAVKYQRKLEADIRRRDTDLKSKTILLGQKDDQIHLLQKMCQVMKESLGPDFYLDEEEVKEAIAMDENQLKSQINELTRQVGDLERDRVSLMRRLRENAAQISERGMRFVGLKAEQIIQLTEFARNLKDGKVELPLNDRSLQLSAKLEELKVMRQSDLITIERLERELQNLKTSNSDIDGNIDSELNIMRNMLAEIQSQNINLRNRIETLNNCGDSKNNCEDISNVLSPLERRRIERVLGVTLERVPNTVHGHFQCFLKEYEKLESELSIMKASMFRWSKNKQVHSPEISTSIASAQTDPYMDINQVDGGMLTGTVFAEKHRIVATCCRSTETDTLVRKDLQVQVCSEKLLSTNQAYNQTSNQGNVQGSIQSNCQDQVQVCSEILLSRKQAYNQTSNQDNVQGSIQSNNQDRDNVILEKLKMAQDQLQVDKHKIKRLKEALKHSLSSNRYENRIMMAQSSVQQLKAMIEEKNKVIQKYRNRCINQLGYDSEVDVVLPDNTKESISLLYEKIETNSTLSQTTETLVKKLHEASTLIQEKEKVIKTLQSDVLLCQEKNDHMQTRYRDALEEVANMKDSYNFLQRRLQQAELSREKFGTDQFDKINGLDMEKTSLESKVNILQLESSQKDIKIERLKSYTIQLKKSLREQEEIAKHVPVLESEIKQVKADLHVCRRTKERWERVASACKTKEADLIEEVDKLESQIIKLRKEVADAKQMKVTALNRSKRIAQKLKESQDTIRRDKEILHENETGREMELYKRKIQSLKNDNVKLRGIVASYAMKEEKVQNPTRLHSAQKHSKSKQLDHNHIKQDTSSVEKSSQTESMLLCDSSGTNREKTYSEAKQSKTLFDYTTHHPNQTTNHSQYLSRFDSEGKEQDSAEEKYDYRNLATLNNNVNYLSQLNNQNVKLIDELKHELKDEREQNETLQSQLRLMNKKLQENNDYTNISHQEHLVETLRQEIGHLKRKLTVANAERSRSDSHFNVKAAELKKENDRLRNELSSFTLDFFEEIEDLKFKYDQASKRLASYGDDKELSGD